MSEESCSNKPFLERYMNGDVLPEDIDDFIDDWHRNPKRKEIFEFLGLTKEEYSIWLRDPDVLPHIARARRDNVDLPTILHEAASDMLIAARSSDRLKIKRLLQWLEQRGKIY
jgi:DNA-directed RNA polymerase specialized sigma subunit